MAMTFPADISTERNLVADARMSERQGWQQRGGCKSVLHGDDDTLCLGERRWWFIWFT